MSFEYAVKKYAELGVDVRKAMDELRTVSISLHCWQGDDVGGFETANSAVGGGGIQVTGKYPGKATTPEELRMDLEEEYSLIPGRHRLNLHASYGDFGGDRVERDHIQPEHFGRWLEWAGENGIAIDFNATLFAHPRADSGFTLSSGDEETRQFWIRHVQQARKIGAHIGMKQGKPCIHNIWIPDGSKDFPVDRMGYRQRLKSSLDTIFETDISPNYLRDALESKLFGIGSEAFVVGSHEFYLAYALTRNKMVCLDMGHFHPTESVADKISALFQFQDELLLHVSRPMRWDSDHIVLFDDDLRNLMQELVRSGKIENTHIGLDFFDASVNRIGAWAIGSRSLIKGLLAAHLEPHVQMLEAEREGNYFARLALLEEAKMLPLGSVWDEYCREAGVPLERDLVKEVGRYEQRVLSRRR